MKKKIFLTLVIVVALACLFAVGVSAEEVLNEGNALITSASDEFATGDQINYITGLANEIYFNGTSSQGNKTLSLEQRMVLKNDDGTYSTFPSAYLFNISKDGSKRAHRFQWLDITLINSATGQTYEPADLIRLEIPEGIIDIHHDDRSSNARLGMQNSTDLKAANLKYLSFPASCTGTLSMGDFARGITTLEEVDFSKMTAPSSFSLSTAFYGCTSLSKVTFPTTFASDGTAPGTCSISDYMFYQCPITTISLPNEIKYIGKHAFRYSSLTSIDISNTIVTEIGEYAFENCDSVVTIKLPTTLTKVNACTFANNENLTFVDFGDNQNTFNMPSWGVFMNCVALKAISLPANTVQIPDRGFSNCKALTAVYLGEKLEAIYGNKGDGAGDGPAFANNTLMYFVQNSFSVTKVDGSFYTAEEFTPPEKPNIYYFPSTLKQIVNGGNLNGYFRTYDFTYTYTTTTVTDESTGTTKTVYVLNVDENGYPVISYGNYNVPNYNGNVLVKDKDGNPIVNEYMYLFEYERDENGDLILTEVKENNKYYMRATIKRDDEGNVVYRLDENGERIKLYDSRGIAVRAMYDDGMVKSSGSADRGIVGCTNLNSVLVFPEDFTGYYDGTQSRNENQRGDILGDGMLTKCATAENPITLVFLGRIDRISMDRRNGNTSYMTYMFANPANTGFDNTKVATYYSPSDSNYSNQNEMYVIFCHAEGGAQKYQIKFAGQEDNVHYPVLNATLQTPSEGANWHLYEPGTDYTSEATCELPAGSFKLCFCGKVCEQTVVEGSVALGHLKDGAEITITFPLVDNVPNYFANQIYNYCCQREGCGKSLSEEQLDTALFEVGGYSTPENGEASGCISHTIRVNKANVLEYERISGDTVNYGVTAGASTSIGSPVVINNLGEIEADTYALIADMTGTQYTKLVIKVTGLEAGNTISCNAYIVFNKESDKIYYLCANKVSKTAVSKSL
ncbi:MAG: leucine-rich repeat domain-containing protein [Clostridia bacterium]|nr:leucine-rich repeat domain-containing protein [Clostridia bacterium]